MPHTNYIGPDGDAWPSVTEVLGIVAKPWIMSWYKGAVEKEGWEGWKKCVATYDEGCKYGQEAHTALETWDLANPAAKLIYEEFCPQVQEFIHQERKVISTRYRYHGTADFICRMEGETGLWVGDWKTSNAMSDWYMVQMAAYANAWNEDNPGQLIDQAVCVHYNKKLKTPKVKITRYYGLKDYFKAFIACREVMDFDRQTGPWKKPDEEV